MPLGRGAHLLCGRRGSLPGWGMGTRWDRPQPPWAPNSAGWPRCRWPAVEAFDTIRFPRRNGGVSQKTDFGVVFPCGRDPLASEASPSGCPAPAPPAPWRLPPASRGRHRRAGWWRARPPNSTPENRLLILPRRVRRRVFSPTVPGALAPQSRPRACGCGLPGAVLPSPAVGGSAPEPSWDVCWGRYPRPGSCCPQTTATSVPKPAGSWVSSGQSESVYTWWPMVTRRRPGPRAIRAPQGPPSAPGL